MTRANDDACDLTWTLMVEMRRSHEWAATTLGLYPTWDSTRCRQCGDAGNDVARFCPGREMDDDDSN